MSASNRSKPSSRQPRGPGRRPGPSTTRDDIINAARESFAKRGYDATSVRAVAAAAGVDPALVRRFFGTKEGLLAAALTLTFGPDDRLAEVIEADLDTLGEHLTNYVFELWEDAPNRDILVGMIRSACTNERAARLLRDFMAGQILARLAGVLTDEEAQLRADLIGAQIVGFAFYRYVVKIEPIASAPPEYLKPILAPAIQRYLTGSLTPPRSRRRETPRRD